MQLLTDHLCDFEIDVLSYAAGGPPPRNFGAAYHHAAEVLRGLRLAYTDGVGGPLRATGAGLAALDIHFAIESESFRSLPSKQGDNEYGRGDLNPQDLREAGAF